MARKSLGKHAVVVGAGMGGLMSAGVLARYFDEVTILDKDDLPDDAVPRKSVPQGAHAHALLVQGRRNLEKIFPGLTSALIDQGAICSRAGLEFALRDAAGWFPRVDIGLQVLSMSRPMLEQTVRQQLDRQNVTFRQGVRVNGWQASDGKITGAAITANNEDEVLQADFFIDATGRSGRSTNWLEAAGASPIEETKLEIGTGYASAIFRKPPDWESSIDAMAINAADPDTRGGFMFSIEDNCWVVSLTGRFDQQPTADPDEYMAFARSLCEPDIANWLSQAERITPIKAYKAPVSRWRHYEKLTNFPQRILPVGDAIAHVNPVYGQGMTLASTHVMGLWDTLAQQSELEAGLDGLDDISASYFQRTHAFTEGVWKSLENVEFSYSGTKGDRPDDINGRIAYSAAMRKVAGEDAEVMKFMLGIAHLVYPPSVLQRPDIAERIAAAISPTKGQSAA